MLACTVVFPSESCASVIGRVGGGVPILYKIIVNKCISSYDVQIRESDRKMVLPVLVSIIVSSSSNTGLLTVLVLASVGVFPSESCVPVIARAQ